MSSSGYDDTASEESGNKPEDDQRDSTQPQHPEGLGTDSVNHGAVLETDAGDSDEDYSSADDSDDDDWPRFQGPASTWREFTKGERGLIASMGQQQANDLGTHLYNAHSLKRRAVRESQATSQGSYASSNKRRKLDESSEHTWQPGRTWTSWPLRPQDVPRPREDFGAPLDYTDDTGTYRQVKQWNRRAELEEEIAALIGRIAREKSREQQRSIQAHDSRGADQEENQSSDSVTSSEDDMVEVKKNAHVPDARRTPGLEFDIDDEAADNLLQPILQDTLDKLDGLLHGLRKKAPRGMKAPSEPESSRPSSSRSQQSSMSQRSANTDTKRSGGIAFLRSDSQSSRIPGSGSSDIGAARSRSPSHITSRPGSANTGSEASQGRKNTPRLTRRPRNWNHIISAALKAGWDSDVIARTAERCTSLFGGESDASTSADSQEDAEGAKSKKATSTVVYRCPFVDCPRHLEPYDKVFRWREHLKRTHKFDRGQIGEAERALKEEVGVGVNRRSRIRITRPIPCPFGDCDRHDLPYEATWRWTEHMKRKHKCAPEEIQGFLRSAMDAEEVRNDETDEEDDFEPEGLT